MPQQHLSSNRARSGVAEPSQESIRFPKRSLAETSTTTLGRFRKALTEWLRRNELSVPFMELERNGDVECVEMAAADLRQRFDDHRIYFRENVIKRNQLDEIKFPLVPELVAMNKGQPVIAVEFEGNLIILQGNHRVYKAVNENPKDCPLQVVLLKSPHAWEQLFEYRLHMASNNQLGFTRPRLDR